MKGMKTYKWKSIAEDSRGEEEKAIKYNTDKCREPERKEERDRDYFIASEANADCVHWNGFLSVQSAGHQAILNRFFKFAAHFTSMFWQSETRH